MHTEFQSETLTRGRDDFGDKDPDVMVQQWTFVSTTKTLGSVKDREFID